MITIEDIAREAGVSCTTVSNVIHGRANRVSAMTVERINTIIRESGYVPNLSARALKIRSSKVVALINHLSPEDRGKFRSDPFFNVLTEAAEQTLRRKGYFLMVRAISDGDELLTFLRNWNVEGILLPGLFEDESLYRTLRNLGMPVVLTDSYIKDLGSMVNVGLQDREGARIATEYLLCRGHRRIVFAGPKVIKGGVVEERLLGYREALEAAGVPFDPSLVLSCPFEVEKMMALGRRLAEMQDITAIFATADLLAAGLMSGLQQAGRAVPRDISIVGFDDIDWCRMTMPMLTTVYQDADAKGRLAADYLLRLLKGEEIGERNRILPVKLVERDSVRRISAETP